MGVHSLGPTLLFRRLVPFKEVATSTPGKPGHKEDDDALAFGRFDPAMASKRKCTKSSNRDIRSGEAHWRGERFVGDFTSARMLSVATGIIGPIYEWKIPAKLPVSASPCSRKAAISYSLRSSQRRIVCTHMRAEPPLWHAPPLDDCLENQFSHLASGSHQRRHEYDPDFSDHILPCLRLVGKHRSFGDG